MATYDFEGSPIAAPITFENKTTTISVETASLRQYRRATEAQRWDLSFRIMTRGDESELITGMIAGDTETRTMVMPQLQSVDKLREDYDEGNAFDVLSISSVGDSQVFLRLTQPLRKGSFIQFTNHSKIYMVMTDHPASNSRDELVTIYPGLRAPVGITDDVRYPNCKTKPSLSYRRALDTLNGITYTDGVLVDVGGVTIEEVV